MFKRFVWIIPVVTVISGAVMYVVYQHLAGASGASGADTSIRGALIAAFIFTTTFTVVLVPAFKVLDYYFPLRNLRQIFLHVTVQTILTVGCYFAAYSLTSTVFVDGMNMAGSEQLINFLISVMITFLVLSFFYLQLFIKRNNEAKKQALTAELSALRAQVNPHFLFNSLNSIASLVKTNPERAENVTQDLADLFRYSLQSSKHYEVSVGEEVQAVKTYIAIEKARFGERLRFTGEIDEQVNHQKIPALILQPLVENSIKHGYHQTDGTFRILLKVESANGIIKLKVTDSGPGFGNLKKAEIFNRGTGLSNVKERLKLHYGARASIKPDGQSVTIEIPL